MKFDFLKALNTSLIAMPLAGDTLFYGLKGIEKRRNDLLQWGNQQLLNKWRGLDYCAIASSSSRRRARRDGMRLIFFLYFYIAKREHFI